MKCIHGVEGEGTIEVRRSNCYACQNEAVELDRRRKVARAALKIPNRWSPELEAALREWKRKEER